MITTTSPNPKSRQPLWRARALLCSLALAGMPLAHACEWQFSLAGSKPVSGLPQLPQFIAQQVRPLLTDKPASKAPTLQVAWRCQPQESEKSLQVEFEIDPASLALQGLAGAPLCSKRQADQPARRQPQNQTQNQPQSQPQSQPQIQTQSQPVAMQEVSGRCSSGGSEYDFRGQRPGSNFLLGPASMLRALKMLAPISGREDLQRTWDDAAQRHALHDALSLFSFVLTGGARFEAVAAAVACLANSGQAVSVSDYWRLLQNWETISQRVMQYQPQLRSARATAGPGPLFVPLESAMVEAFNRSLATHPPGPEQITSDGKNKPVSLPGLKCAPPGQHADTPQQRERDEILLLAAMSMVHQDWQHDASGHGHNIGTLLADPQGKPVYWARNAVRKLNATQHGEVRAIQGYLACPGVGKNLKGYTLYTTLEPCAMCAGMITMSQVERVVYLQADPVFGQIRQALESLDYLRRYDQATLDHLPQKRSLDAHFEHYRRSSGNSAATLFLLSAEAKSVFASASHALEQRVAAFPENAALLAQVKQFLQTVTAELPGQSTKTAADVAHAAANAAANPAPDPMLARCPASVTPAAAPRQ